MIRSIITITGASGVGKSTLEARLTHHFGDGKVRTITTRERRLNETDRDYYFETMERYHSHTDLMWKVQIHGAWYAVAESEFLRAFVQTGDIAFLCIVPEYHTFVANWFSKANVRCVPVHLDHPGEAELRRRLIERGESASTIAKRMADLAEYEEAALHVRGLYRIPPGTREETFQKVLTLIKS